jgi:hypothetical protein
MRALLTATKHSPVYLLVTAASLAALVSSAALGIESCDAERAVDASPSDSISVYLDDQHHPIVPTPSVDSGRGEQGGSAADEPSSGQPTLPQFQPAPGGGEMLLLDDRFRHDMRGTRRAAGSIAAECTQPGAAAMTR